MQDLFEWSRSVYQAESEPVCGRIDQQIEAKINGATGFPFMQDFLLDGKTSPELLLQKSEAVEPGLQIFGKR